MLAIVVRYALFASHSGPYLDLLSHNRPLLRSVDRHQLLELLVLLRRAKTGMDVRQTALLRVLI